MIANARAQESLRAQLSQLVDVANIKIVIGQPDAASKRDRSEAPVEAAITPAERKNQEEIDLQQQRRESIVQHPVVQLLQAQTDAQLIEESIVAREDAPESISSPATAVR